MRRNVGAPRTRKHGKRSRGGGREGSSRARSYIKVTDLQEGTPVRTIDLKSDRPPVREALERLERELAAARRDGHFFLKIVHGYGSTGAGGDIRIAAQKWLIEMVEAGRLGGCIFGENWSKSDEASWRLLQRRAELKNDPDLGRRNAGITIVVL